MQLRDLYPKLTASERETLAKKAGTDAGYLWQLATQWRGKRPSLDLMAALANADKRLTLGELAVEFAPELKKRKDSPKPKAVEA